MSITSIFVQSHKEVFLLRASKKEITDKELYIEFKAVYTMFSGEAWNIFHDDIEEGSQSSQSSTLII